MALQKSFSFCHVSFFSHVTTSSEGGPVISVDCPRTYIFGLSCDESRRMVMYKSMAGGVRIIVLPSRPRAVTIAVGRVPVPLISTVVNGHLNASPVLRLTLITGSILHISSFALRRLRNSITQALVSSADCRNPSRGGATNRNHTVLVHGFRIGARACRKAPKTVECDRQVPIVGVGITSIETCGIMYMYTYCAHLIRIVAKTPNSRPPLDEAVRSPFIFLSYATRGEWFAMQDATPSPFHGHVLVQYGS